MHDISYFWFLKLYLQVGLFEELLNELLFTLVVKLSFLGGTSKSLSICTVKAQLSG